MALILIELVESFAITVLNTLYRLQVSVESLLSTMNYTFFPIASSSIRKE